MHLVPTDPFLPPATAPPLPEVVALDHAQVAHLLTRAFEMLAVTLAIQYGQVDDDAAEHAGLSEPITIDIVSRAVVFGAALVAQAHDDGLRLVDMWEKDWGVAFASPVRAFEAMRHD